jgi:hypothetical protein
MSIWIVANSSSLVEASCKCIALPFIDRCALVVCHAFNVGIYLASVTNTQSWEWFYRCRWPERACTGVFNLSSP